MSTIGAMPLSIIILTYIIRLWVRFVSRKFCFARIFFFFLLDVRVAVSPRLPYLLHATHNLTELKVRDSNTYDIKTYHYYYYYYSSVSRVKNADARRDRVGGIYESVPGILYNI